MSGVRSLFVRVLAGFLGSSFVVSSLLDEHVLEVRSLFVSVLAVPYDCHVSSVIDSQSHTTRTTPSFAPSSPPSGSRA